MGEKVKEIISLLCIVSICVIVPVAIFMGVKATYCHKNENRYETSLALYGENNLVTQEYRVRYESMCGEVN